MPDQLIKIMRLPVWQGIMAHFLNDEFASYTGEEWVYAGFDCSFTLGPRF
jgi:hypothetical protein